MKLLLSNDDGFDAPGLHALAQRLQALGEVWVVAPATEQSAKSHSLTMHHPLRVHARAPRRWAVTGTPADCIYVALHHLLDAPPDLVVSGINDGSNLGTDVHYSGTVAAAREACLHGVPAVAVSLHKEPSSPTLHWETAAEVAARVVTRALAEGLPHRVLLNVNVPNRPLDALAGIRATRVGDRVYEHAVDERTDPRGQPYVWIGGSHLHFGEPEDDADGPAVEAGFASVSPVSAQITDVSTLEQLRAWYDH